MRITALEDSYISEQSVKFICIDFCLASCGFSAWKNL
jgi:hypothetical protein